MIDFSVLPSVNAALNALAFVLLLAGFIAIHRGAITVHKRFMLAAFATSALFLASYLTYHYTQPVTPFAGHGIARVVYFAILVPHILLAAGMVPMVLLTLRRALRRDFVAHRRVARWTLPVWLYVSVTGVAVYAMLYHLYPAS